MNQHGKGRLFWTLFTLVAIALIVVIILRVIANNNKKKKTTTGAPVVGGGGNTTTSAPSKSMALAGGLIGLFAVIFVIVVVFEYRGDEAKDKTEQWKAKRVLRAHGNALNPFRRGRDVIKGATTVGSWTKEKASGVKNYVGDKLEARKVTKANKGVTQEESDPAFIGPGRRGTSFRG